MTWNEMTHEVKDLKNLLINDKKELIGFIVSGETYDGDGNIQDEDGTNMEIVFKNKEHFLKIMNQIQEGLKDGNTNTKN